jgi:prephenate dehydratase
MKVAIQGELGSFSHEAARKMLPGCTVIPCARSIEVFDQLDSGKVPVVVIPIENTLAGTVTEHADLLLARDVFIQREFHLRIVHNLIGRRGARKSEIKRVLSHPVALDQCREFLRKNPQVTATPFYDTAGSVKHVIENDFRDAAGIAGRHAASVYKGEILAAGIEDDKRNFTRFFLLRKRKHILPRANKTSVAFGLKNVPGALYKALRVFADRDISLSKIESRPIRGRPWEYVFFADLLRGDDKLARGALLQLRAVVDMVKVLGVYPAARS